MWRYRAARWRWRRATHPPAGIDPRWPGGQTGAGAAAPGIRGRAARRPGRPGRSASAQPVERGVMAIAFVLMMCPAGVAVALLRRLARAVPAGPAARGDVPEGLLRWAGLLSAQREEWGQATLGEVDYIDGRSSAVTLCGRRLRRRDRLVLRRRVSAHCQKSGLLIGLIGSDHMAGSVPGGRSRRFNFDNIDRFTRE
jgi:hypothetical protein